MNKTIWMGFILVSFKWHKQAPFNLIWNIECFEDSLWVWLRFKEGMKKGPLNQIGINWIILLLNLNSVYLLFSFSILKWRNKTRSNSSKTSSNCSQWMCPSELFFDGERNKSSTQSPILFIEEISFTVFPFP